MYKIIHDIDEIDRFLDFLYKPLSDNEAYFISLSARNKYLTEQEREYYSLGRTEMYAKTIVYDKEDCIKKLYRFQCDDLGYTTRNGKTIPSKTMVCYANINPADMTKAYLNFTARVAKEYPNVKNIHNWLMIEIQKSRSKKYWLDIDIDSENWETLQEVLSHMLVNIPHMVIKTKSGCHMLVDMQKLKEENLGRQLHETAQRLTKELEVGEVVINKNEMVPIPGTYQANVPVTIYSVWRN